ncbi:MAG: outer membrane beta-barrel protein, partial [Bacteroidetes bacterium]|nr:outer membrane beta-barrel protein [Bacteroidota bacterium]
MKIKFLFTLLIALMCFSTMQAQEAPTFSVSGTVDTYYRSTEFAPGTSFANLNGFALGMANIVLSYEGEKSGFVADLVYGPRG